MDLVVSLSDEDALLERLMADFKVDRAQAEAVFGLEQGYASLSAKALRKILPFLRAGQDYAQACVSAGYNHSTPTVLTKSQLEIADVPDIRNPTVSKALFELRRVVNAIQTKFKPTCWRVEFAREMERISR